MFTIKKLDLINYCIAAIPFSLILGNLAINVNIVIICLIGVLIYKKKIFTINDQKYQFLIFAFFFYLILITLLNNLPKLDVNPLYKQNIYKSFFFLRFLLLFLVVSKLLEENKINLKLFFISGAFCSFFLSIDIVIQVIFGSDLFGNKISSNRPSGFFGKENIAGGYLQKFILFFIFYFLIFLINIKNKNFFITFLFICFLIPIILTGNRMPIFLYIGSCIIFFILEKKFKEMLAVSIVSGLIIFFLIKNPFFYKINNNISAFFQDTHILINNTPSLFINNQLDESKISFGRQTYLLHFNTGIQIWKKNKLFGHGLKSFPLNCQYENNQTCNTHPHNYFIEIMTDMGIIGITLIYSIFIIGLINFFRFYFKQEVEGIKFISIPFFLITFFEFFPIRSSGSFFTTNNSIVIFIMLAIFLNSKKISRINFLYKK